MSKRKTSSPANAELTPGTEEFDLARRRTIEMLHPEVLQEMRDCAHALDMNFDDFVEVLNRAAEDPEYYENMGDNESYRDYNWDKIWVGWTFLSNKPAPPTNRWGHKPLPFSCAC